MNYEKKESIFTNKSYNSEKQGIYSKIQNKM
jgi:hypothetical protein